MKKIHPSPKHILQSFLLDSMLDDGLAPAFLFTVITCGWRWWCDRADKKKWEIAYWGERQGRTRVEKEMRRIAQHQLSTDNGFFVQPIGHIESCYRQVIGTPRQGALVPESRASIVLTSNMSPDAMDGLDEFSHVWLTFHFHMNTNTLKEAKAFKGVVQVDPTSRHTKQAYTFTAKITPPMLKEKKGVANTPCLKRRKGY